MKVASKHLSVAVTVVVFSLQSVFAGDDETPNTENNGLPSANVTISTPTQNSTVSVLPLNDGLIAIIAISAIVAPSDQDEELAGADDIGESIHAREWLMLMDTGFTIDYWLGYPSYSDEAVMEWLLICEEFSSMRPTSGPHIPTIDGLFRLDPPVK